MSSMFYIYIFSGPEISFFWSSALCARLCSWTSICAGTPTLPAAPWDRLDCRSAEVIDMACAGLGICNSAPMLLSSKYVLNDYYEIFNQFGGKFYLLPVLGSHSVKKSS